VTPVTDASVAIIKGVHISSLPEYSHIVHRPVSIRITQLVFSCQDYCVLWCLFLK